ncbi:MAG: phosphate acyltransferase PlsX [Pseudomonadales bacterium]|nr:phosphate acyltransferase PlsX [Pseudomonadales bacterium]
MSAVTLAVDAMGGDHGPRVTVPAVIDLLRDAEDASVILVGHETEIRKHLPSGWQDSLRVTVVHTEEVVLSDDPVSVALRQKKHSSMRLAIELVRDGRAHAVVSAGNTGALMAVSRFVLKTHALIDRPAILTALPTQGGHCHMLDLGANVDSSPENLLQFAHMGSIVAECLDGIARPRVGLLNIGEEDIKGNDLIKKTNQLLQESGLNYIGYIEGDRVFLGQADVVVCDGFVGNVALKFSEGVARMFAQRIRDEIERSWMRRFLGAMALPIWRGLKKQMDPSHYNGASLVGLTGIVVKSHGGAERVAFVNALRVALREAAINMPDLIAERLVISTTRN